MTNSESPNGDKKVISKSVQRLLGTGDTANGWLSFWRTSKTRATADQIRELQCNESLKDRYVVVDVRAKAESDVSIIPGAITKAEFGQTKTEHVGKTIIAYCTIGFRSGLYVKSLKRNGWNAWNYRGSIIDWCENKFPLATLDSEATNRVHTYNRWYSVPDEYVAVPERK